MYMIIHKLLGKLMKYLIRINIDIISFRLVSVVLSMDEVRIGLRRHTWKLLLKMYKVVTEVCC